MLEFIFMGYRLFILLFLLIVPITGCKHIWPQNAKTEPVQVKKPIQEQTGRIISPARLKQGGKLVIIPFIPGEGVAATDRLDRISLTMIKGINNTLDDRNLPLELVFAEQQRRAQLAITGRVTRQTAPSTFKKWFMFKEGLTLGVAGQMEDVQTGKLVLTFDITKKTRRADQTYDDLAYQIGQEIGQLILKGFN